MKRKLIKQGGGGFTFYLPKKWADSHGLKAGDEIDLIEVNDALLLRSEGSNVAREILIKLNEEAPRRIKMQLTHAYRLGYDTIIVQYSGPDAPKVISEVVSKNMIGFEMTHKDKNKCVLQNITEPTDEKFNVILRRVFLLIKETQEAIRLASKDGAQNYAQDIERFRDDFDKHVYFCRRVISKKMSINENGVLNWELLSYLMNIQHLYYYLYSDCDKTRQSTDELTQKLLVRLEQHFNTLYESYFERNSEKLDAFYEVGNEISEEIKQQLSVSSKRDKLRLSYLHMVSRFITTASSPVLSILYDEKLNESMLFK